MPRSPETLGRPTEVTFELPEGYALKDARWSVPERFETDGIVQFGYSGTAYYKTTVVPLPRPERRIEIPLQVSWLACREECIPEKFSLVLSFEVTDLNPAPGSVFKSALAAAESRLSERRNPRRLPVTFLFRLFCFWLLWAD